MICFLTTPLTTFANSKKIPEFISQKSILKNKDVYLKKLPEKKGYKSLKIWNTLINDTIKTKDEKSLKHFLSKVFFNVQYEKEYTLDLIKILNQEPEFFLKTTNSFFKGNKDCATWILNLEGFSIDKSAIKLVSQKKLKESYTKQISNIKTSKISKSVDRFCRRTKVAQSKIKSKVKSSAKPKQTNQNKKT